MQTYMFAQMPGVPHQTISSVTVSSDLQINLQMFTC